MAVMAPIVIPEEKKIWARAGNTRAMAGLKVTSTARPIAVVTMTALRLSRCMSDFNCLHTYPSNIGEYREVGAAQHGGRNHIDDSSGLGKDAQDNHNDAGAPCHDPARLDAGNAYGVRHSVRNR